MAALIFKGETYTFNADRFMNMELMEMERVSRKIGYPLTAGQWQQELSEYGMTAVTLLIYLLKKRKNPQFQFEEIGEYATDDVELTADEPVTPEPAPLDPTNVETSGSQLIMRNDN